MSEPSQDTDKLATKPPQSPLGCANTIAILSLVVAAITTIFSACQVRSSAIEASLLATQVADLLAKPTLETTAFYQTGTRNNIDQLRSNMIDEFFRAMYALQAQSPEVPAAQLVREISPIRRDIPPASIEIVTEITNTGTENATDVSVQVVWIGEIAEISVVTLSRWAIIDGGVGSQGVTLSVDRLAIGETLEVSVEYAPTKDTTDMLELSVDHPDANFVLPNFLFSSDLPSLPTFLIIPGEFTPSYDLISVRISANESQVQEAQVVPGPLEKYLDLLKR